MVEWRTTVTVTLVLCMLIGYSVCAEETVNCGIADKTGLPSDVCTFDLRMKGAQPKESDEYYCAGYQVSNQILGAGSQPSDDGYIVRYEALADADTAHHILIFGCAALRKNVGKIWHCGQVCEGADQIIFAWAKNAPGLSLPTDVGQHIGGLTTGIKYIVIQIHYAKPQQAPDYSGIRIYTTRQRQPYIAGIYLLLNYGMTIPQNTPKFHVDSSCKFTWSDSIVPFGYRTHAHILCRVISGYKVAHGQYELIGKGNPQWPQAFYPVERPVVINPGDILSARCTYNSTGRFRGTEIGSTANDEMCNFYIMYYMNSTMEGRKGPDTCYKNRQSRVFLNYPADSDTPLPPNPALEGVAMAHHHHGMGGSNDVDDQHMDGNKVDEPIVETEHPLVDFHGDSGISDNSGTKLNKEMKLKFISAVSSVEIGQVGGLAVNSAGDLYIFHRGSNIWSQLSFSALNVYMQQKLPVDVDTVVILNKDGVVKRHFGKNRFFLPHGLSLDSKENIWLTDVALHQVFRIPKGGVEPDLTLGMRFEPGTDNEHFCKPSDVAVLSTGEFFVSDGYCNSRIMKFDKNGYFVKEWGTQSASWGSDGFPPPGTFNLPHSVTVAEDRDLLCVADRENGRIQCFDLEGNFIRQMHPAQFGKALYAVEYCPNHGGVLFAVNGPLFGQDSVDTQGLTLDIDTGALLAIWNIPGEGLTHPHDVAVDSARHVVYVGELNPRKVWKFQIGKTMQSANSSADVTKPAGENKPVAVSGVTKGTSMESSTINVVMVSSKVAFTSISVVNKDSTPVHTVSVGHSYDMNRTDGGTHSASPVPVNDRPLNVDIINVDIPSPALHQTDGKDDNGFGPSVVIGTLLVAPVLLLVTVTIIVRLYKAGRFKHCGRQSGKKSVFSLDSFLHSHKGFDRLSTEDDDHDGDKLLDDDSDNEEFNIVRKA